MITGFLLLYWLLLYGNWFPTTILATIRWELVSYYYIGYYYMITGFLLLYWLLFYMITGFLLLYWLLLYMITGFLLLYWLLLDENWLHFIELQLFSFYKEEHIKYIESLQHFSTNTILTTNEQLLLFWNSNTD